MTEEQMSWKQFNEDENLFALGKAGVEFVHKIFAKSALIRTDEVSADFYLTTNKWKDNKKGQKVHYGNADRFIEWMKKQEAQE